MIKFGKHNGETFAINRYDGTTSNHPATFLLTGDIKGFEIGAWVDAQMYENFEHWNENKEGQKDYEESCAKAYEILENSVREIYGNVI